MCDIVDVEPEFRGLLTVFTLADDSEKTLLHDLDEGTR